MTDLKALTAALIAAHETKQRIAPPAQELSRSEVLAVQQSVASALGPVAGFKVGRVPDAPPILAPLPACYRLPDGGTYALGDRLGVELEVGFEVIRPLPGPTLPDRPQDYLRPRVILELVDTRFNAPDLSANAKFCDFQMNGGLIVGQGDFVWDGRDFGVIEGNLTVGDQTVLDGEATVPGGSALENLSALLAHLGGHCGGVQQGQILITGSVNGLPYFTESAQVHGKIAGLGAVSVRLTRM